MRRPSPAGGPVSGTATALAVSLVLALAFGALVAAAAVGATRSDQERPFPHEDHAGLFPVCTGCHVPADPGGDPGYPGATLCAQCHDGADLPAVDWSTPGARPSNLSFDHATHAAELVREGESPQSCETCHSQPGGPRMDVPDRAIEESCFACHAGEPGDHFAAPATDPAACEVCHVSLAESRFPVERIAHLPVPADHEQGAFLAEAHGEAAAAGAARCATCHTAERCLTCHVDADNPVVGRVPAAPATMELPAATAAYPVPASHLTELWGRDHAPVSTVDGCVTCHTTDDCRACHVEPGPAIVDALPTRADVAAPGAGLSRSEPGSHVSPFFMEAHATMAAADDGTCATCHTEASCTDCHDGPAGGSYHPSGFVGSHAATAFGRADECASCHQTAVFCRSCHLESGLGSTGRLGAGYHDAEPVWLLRHGQAARQNLESCASCHQQRDCVQCHGVLGSFGVSPHEPGFDAASAWARSPRTCLACHVGDPLSGGA